MRMAGQGMEEEEEDLVPKERREGDRQGHKDLLCHKGPTMGLPLKTKAAKMLTWYHVGIILDPRPPKNSPKKFWWYFEPFPFERLP